MTVSIGITPANRKKMAERLNVLLADEYVLYQKTWGFHWNLYGSRFYDLHIFFEKQFNELADHVDLVAERVLQLGHQSLISLATMVKNSRLKEAGEKVPTDDAMIAALLADHEAIIRTLRGDIEDAREKFKDAGTENFLAELIVKHEKMAWMLRAFLEKAEK